MPESATEICERDFLSLVLRASNSKMGLGNGHPCCAGEAKKTGRMRVYPQPIGATSPFSIVVELAQSPRSHDHAAECSFAATYWRFQEREGGAYFECRAISLRHDVPVGR